VRTYRLPALSVILSSLLGLFSPTALGAEAQPESARPRLAVLVFFDQFRGDYLMRWDKLFGEGGFHRLEQEGTWFQNCHYPYAHTVTGTGHASVSTGCSPAKHGIIGNDWYNRSEGQLVNCVASAERYEQVPPLKTTSDKGIGKKKKGVSPERLLMPTLADALKEATGGKGRVVALSLKDRAAVLPGGRQPDACYWADSNTGTFVTSTYYRERLHPWVEEYNRSGVANWWYGRFWDRLRPDLIYEHYSGPDDVVGEGKGVGQGRTFPHPFPFVAESLRKNYYEALANSPFGNDLLLGLAKQAIVAEGLGKHEVPDLLTLSFSSNDLIGHAWGPDSQEVLDVTLRSDLIVKELLTFLDAQVGKGKYVLVLTADHGICPLPEVSRMQGKDAQRVPAPEMKAEAFLAQSFGSNEGQGRWLEAAYHPWLYLNQDLIRRRGLKAAVVEEALADWLKKQPGVLTAYTRTQLLQGVPKEDTIGQKVAQSFHPDRAGDIMVVMKPYYLVTTLFGTGTNHSTPHPYDTHVPLLIHGPSIRHAVRQEAITPQAATVILAQALGIKPLAGAEAVVPENVFGPSLP
jgi:hypothetical protein